MQPLHGCIGIDGSKHGLAGGRGSSTANAAELRGRGSHGLSHNAADTERIDAGTVERGYFGLQERGVQCSILRERRENGRNHSPDSELGHWWERIYHSRCARTNNFGRHSAAVHLWYVQVSFGGQLWTCDFRSVYCSWCSGPCLPATAP